MKNTIMNITVMLLMFLFIQKTSVAQGSMKTDTITVFGNCGQCKTRIEEASFIKGVKIAEWNTKTKILTITYNRDKTSREQIMAAVAKAGHDSDNHKAEDKAYKKLPGCCAYRTGTCSHD